MEQGCSRGFPATQESIKKTVPFLGGPDFTKVFVVETNASQHEIRAVLMQDRHPLAYISKVTGAKWHELSIYEKCSWLWSLQLKNATVNRSMTRRETLI